jgi:hypothetical protein
MRAGHRQRRLRQEAQGRAFDGKAERARLAEMACGLAGRRRPRRQPGN